MAQVSSSFRRPSYGSQDEDVYDRSGPTFGHGTADDTNVLRFPSPPPPARGGSSALDLIYQAADVFAGIEDRARDTEARARALCQSAIERLQLAEQRVAAAERARREAVDHVGRKLEEASRALAHAKSRIEAAEARAAAAEARALAAESEAQTARRALAQVEDAIRSRLLGDAVADAVRDAYA